MKMMRIFAYACFTFLILLFTKCSLVSDPIDYNTQVKPILNNKCISCHGGVKQNGGFSLLSRKDALKKTESGVFAIQPGNASSSEMIRRLKLDDPEERMPYQSEPLSQEEIKILTKWVNQGAKWGLHWAYQPLQPQDEVKTMGPSSHPKTITSQIDQFITAQQKEMNLLANEAATKSELLRRASLAIIGIPPPSAIKTGFLEGDITYEQLIDTLLSLPAFGEKWASMWLDIARYADTKGFERDGKREIWRYRDYVIKSFNEDKKYKDFIVEQIAGDLLDNPSEENYIATGFHRNTQTNDEGGTDNEEFRVKAVMDRVSTTWEGILGTTMACVQCHGHPYDPFPHKDYFTSYAFFNNTRDADTYQDYPLLEILDSLDHHEINELSTWIDQVGRSDRVEFYKSFIKTTQPVIYSLETSELVDAALYDTKFLGIRNHGSAKISQVQMAGKESFWMRVRFAKKGGTLTLHLNHPNGIEIGKWQAKEDFGQPRIIDLPLKDTSGLHDVFLAYHNPHLKDPDAAGVSFDWFFFSEAFPGSDDPNISTTLLQEKKAQFVNLIEKERPTTPIMIENPREMRRTTHIFDRGNWQIHGEEVFPDVPEILPPLSASDAPDRLDFAKWIAKEENPLTARTYVNRIWEQIFGRGLVRTVEDLGSQGETPSHPELLDYLATELMYTQKWSTKALIKSILLTSAFQQSAKNNPDDPENVYLTAGPRFRLKAEQVRDQALTMGGLLTEKLYGPPVMPYQPEGIWKSPYSGDEWELSEGENKYRRAIYTFIKRTAVYPSFETYDMAQRQVCTSRRIRTNTPLQALVTLNDPVYIEASEALAKRMIEADDELEKQIDFGYQLGMFKKIPESKLLILKDLYASTKSEAQKDIQEENIGLIAMTAVANAILNLDEMLNN